MWVPGVTSATAGSCNNALKPAKSIAAHTVATEEDISAVQEPQKSAGSKEEEVTVISPEGPRLPQQPRPAVECRISTHNDALEAVRERSFTTKNRPSDKTTIPHSSSTTEKKNSFDPSYGTMAESVNEGNTDDQESMAVEPESPIFSPRRTVVKPDGLVTSSNVNVYPSPPNAANKREQAAGPVAFCDSLIQNRELAVGSIVYCEWSVNKVSGSNVSDLTIRCIILEPTLSLPFKGILLGKNYQKRAASQFTSFAVRHSLR